MSLRPARTTISQRGKGPQSCGMPGMLTSYPGRGGRRVTDLLKGHRFQQGVPCAEKYTGKAPAYPGRKGLRSSFRWADRRPTPQSMGQKDRNCSAHTSWVPPGGGKAHRALSSPPTSLFTVFSLSRSSVSTKEEKVLEQHMYLNET